MSVPDYAFTKQKRQTKSEFVGQILIAFLYLYLGLKILLLLSFILRVISPSSYSSFEVNSGLQGRIEFAINLLTFVIFLVWIYRVHIDLKSYFRRYVIGPGGALARLLVPLYNLWGVWDLFATLASRFKEAGGELGGYGSDIRFWLLLLYGSGILSRVLDRVIFLQIRTVVPPRLVLVEGAVDAIFAFALVGMTRAITKGMTRLSEELYIKPLS